MSVEFDPPAGLNAAHLGAFWATFRDRFPNVHTTTPIGPTAENFEAAGQWIPPSLRLALSDRTDCRIQMVSGDDQWMWQVQSDRLVVNWRKRGDAYPRYSAALDRFREAWKAWLGLLRQEQIDRPQSRLWHLTYVNRIPQGDLWDSPRDWAGVFPGLWGTPAAVMGELQLKGLRGQWVWEHATIPARLHVESSPARVGYDTPQDLLILNLTARGPVASLPGDAVADAEGLTEIEAGLHHGHEMIVCTFDTVTSSKAKEHWGRHDHTRE